MGRTGHGRARRPPQWKLLWQGLREDRSESQTIELISVGCELAVKNAGRLGSNVELLVSKQCFATAMFLVTVIEEELAKVMILIDLARLDFIKHDNIAKDLCWAFYDHVSKAAYVQVWRSSRFRSMQDVAKKFESARVKWWPSDGYEEPDMIHTHLLWREFSVYVDMDWTHGEFAGPDDKHARFFFTEEDLSSTGWSKTLDLVAEFDEALRDGILSARSLDILHSNCSKHLFGKDSPPSLIQRAYAAMCDELLREGVVSEEQTAPHNVLCGWPLYRLLRKEPC